MRPRTPPGTALSAVAVATSNSMTPFTDWILEVTPTRVATTTPPLLRGRPLPARHGAPGDPRYPSPRRLRRLTAFVIDWGLHAGIAAAAVALCDRIPELKPFALLAALASWAVVSFIHRTVVQRAFRCTAGKAIVGLWVIRPEYGTAPTFGYLVKWWLIGLVGFVVSQEVPDEDANGFPSVVRVCDLSHEPRPVPRLRVGAVGGDR